MDLQNKRKIINVLYQEWYISRDKKLEQRISLLVQETKPLYHKRTNNQWTKRRLKNEMEVINENN